MRIFRIPRKHFDRELLNAVWAWSKHAEGGAITRRMALCIIHCAMRTMESCIRTILAMAAERYVSGNAEQKRIVTRHLNNRLYHDLKLRPLISTNDKGELNKITLNGGEIRAIMRDLLAGESCLLSAITNTYAELKISEHDTHLRAWANALKHWATAMNAAYDMRATREQRTVFAHHIRLYVLEKGKINNQELVWYDWQLWSIFPKLFDRYGSLMAISQEGMEAIQKRNNALQRHSNNNANAGRLPTRVIQAGLEAIKAYLLERKKRVKSSAAWLWERQLLAFMSVHHEVFEEMERCKVEGRVMDWRTEFVPEWESFKASSRIMITCRAKYRQFKAKDAGSRYYAKLVEERNAYYAPCECELRPSFWEMRPEDQARELQRARKTRWAARRAAGHVLLKKPVVNFGAWNL